MTSPEVIAFPARRLTKGQKCMPHPVAFCLKVWRPVTHTISPSGLHPLLHLSFRRRRLSLLQALRRIPTLPRALVVNKADAHGHSSHLVSTNLYAIFMSTSHGGLPGRQSALAFILDCECRAFTKEGRCLPPLNTAKHYSPPVRWQADTAAWRMRPRDSNSFTS